MSRPGGAWGWRWPGRRINDAAVSPGDAVFALDGGNRRLSPLLVGFTWLLLFQCAGEALVRLASLPVPGPVAGMALLFVVLLVKGRPPEAMSTASEGLAKHLSLLFVPAGVGVMLHVARVADEWMPIVVALGVSTVLAIAAPALTFQWLGRRHDADPGERES